tara:strand:+ start:1990 stop:2544 length:555 start_codon:yes stop_codon:yes gene_type:complete
MNKKQKKYVMAGILGLGLYSTYRMSQSGLGALGFLTLPYEYSPSAPSSSYSYNPTPSFNEYSYPVKFTSDNRSPFEEGYYENQIPSFSSQMDNDAFFNMVRQISETDGKDIIQNATAFTSEPTIMPGASLKDLRNVKSQVSNAASSPRLTSDQKAYLGMIAMALSERIIALTPADDTSAIGGIF